MALTKSQRSAVRKMFGCRCAYCGHPLGEKWHADHVKAVQRKVKYVRDEKSHRQSYRAVTVGMRNPENDHVDNFYPACIPCNIDKSCDELEHWRELLADKIHVALRGSSALRHAQRFGMVEISEAPIVFWFEKYVGSEDLNAK